MDRRDAEGLLGLAAGAAPDEVRSAFRRLVLRHHPDVEGGDAAATRALTEAYRTLRQGAPEPVGAPVVLGASDDTVHLDLPPDEAFLHLLEAGAALGEVTYVDADAGLLEVVVAFDDGRSASLVVTLQGRATGVTDAFCTLEARGAGGPPPVAVVIEELVRRLG